MLRNSALATFLVTASFSLVFFSGCAEKNADGTTKKKERILPPSSGTHSELLLVMPDALWEGAPGKEFRALYLADVEGLPQAEAYFDASRVEPKDVNKILQKTKSIPLYLGIPPSPLLDQEIPEICHFIFRNR